MKNSIFYITALLAFPFWAKAQSPNQNYTTSTAYQKEYTWAEVQGNIPLDDKVETVTYYDGLGRPVQSVAQRVGGDRENLVSHISYDPIGRKPLDYLPLPEALNSNNEAGEFYVPTGPSIPNELKTYYRNKFPEDFYQGSGLQPDYDNPYSEKLLEASPLNRVLEQGAPGYDWHADYNDHTIQFGYEANGVNEVYHFSVDFGSSGTDYTDPLLQYEGYYPANELLRNVTKDENWLPADGNDHTVQEFTDKEGRMVLKRAFNGAETLDTYYIYDDSGRLSFVLSPEASDQIVVSGGLSGNADGILNELGYRYRYDYRGRIFEKKTPGMGWEHIIYDALDRPILTQDAEQLKNNEWLFTKFDVLGRVAYTGILSNHSKSQVQSGLNGLPLYENQQTGTTTINGTAVYYSNQAFPTSDIEVHSIAYYDTYVDTGSLGAPPAQNVYSTSITTYTQGLPTVSKVRVLDGLDDPTPSQYWITTVTGYDDKVRPIYVNTENPYLFTKDKVESDLDFTGKPIEARTHHEVTGVSSNSILTLDYFTYDHIGRLLTHEQQVDSEPIQLIAKNHYDELGQLHKKEVGGETFIDGYTGIEKADVSHDGTITRNSGGGDWTSGAKTKGEIVNDGGVAITVSQTDKALRFGLRTTNIVFFDGWNEYDYGLELHPDADGNGTTDVKVIINNVLGSIVETFQVGDSFSVERVGSLIEFRKNGSSTPFYTHNGASSSTLVGKVALYGTAASTEAFTLFGETIDIVLQEVDYDYNVRGWLTAINDVDDTDQKNTDLFHFRINYNEAIEGNVGAAGVEPLFNGNISQTVWRTENTDAQKRTYGYTYDALNRLTNAYSRKGSDLNTTDHYGVSGIIYDLNGNIGHLDRNGTNGDGTVNGVWDDLTYYYENGTNRLINVLDSSGFPTLVDEGFRDGNTGPFDDFEYDDNGNMVVDRNKGITNISYNHFNLPETVTVNGSQTGTISYIYDAGGTKLKKTLTENGNTHTTKYAGGYIYLDDELQFFSHSEGYVKPVSGTSESVKGSLGGQTTQSGYQYVFQYLDHLGNVRLSYADSDLDGSISTNEIVEESNYYAFGTKQKGYNYNVQGGNSLAQKWKYNDIELNEDLSLNLYEMEVRQYDPAIARWTGIDPVTHHDFSPYNAFDNNPIYWADPSGADGMPGPGASKALPREVQRAYDTGSTRGLGSSFSMDLGGMPANGVNTANKFRVGLATGGQKPTDWIRNQASGEYVWDGDVTSVSNTPDGFDYVGKSTVDVTNHFKKNHPFLSLVKDPKYGEDRTPWPGEILADPETFVDRWKKSDGILANMSYDLTNKFYVTLQIFNPLDDQLTFLDGEGFYGNGAEYVAEVFGTVITGGAGSTVSSSSQGFRFSLSSLKHSTGGFKQWLRVGNSYSVEGGFKTYGLRWGAAKRYKGKIKNLTLRKWNQKIRNLKIPGTNWRVQDAGHFHFWRR